MSQKYPEKNDELEMHRRASDLLLLSQPLPTLGMITVRSQISTKLTRSRSFTQWTSQVGNPLKFLFEQAVFSNSSFQRIMLETSNTSETCFLKAQIRNIGYRG